MSSVGAREAASGPWGRVIWAEDASGGSPARDFFISLPVGDQTKVMALLKRMAETGQIQNREKFKKVGDLFEFKSFQIRFIGDFRVGRVFVVAHGVRKKRNELRPEDLARAQRILDEHDAK